MNITTMVEGDKGESKIIKGEKTPSRPIQRYGVNGGSILQSLWVRCRSIFPTPTNRQFMEGELRFVLYCGLIFWSLYLVWEIFG